MNKEEFIKRYGGMAYEKWLQQTRDWKAQHREERSIQGVEWRAVNPDKVKANNQELSHKGGKYYLNRLKYKTTGLTGKKARTRVKHANQYRPFKQTIAPESQIHHEWIPGTAEYTGVALVETDQHRYGIIDVIKILEGKITLLTEKEVKGAFKCEK